MFDFSLVDLPDIGGWRFEYLYPGVPSWSRGRITVCASPDWEGAEGVISIDISNDRGEAIRGLEVPYQQPLTREDYLTIMSRVLGEP